jgi:hypothetical protein
MSNPILDLENISLGSARGRKAKPFYAQVQRELNAGDLEVLLNPPEVGEGLAIVKKMRNTHHMLARLLAEGRPPGECALVTGYSSSRISILQNDPAFKELVAYYRGQAQEKFLNVHERLASLGLAAIDELQERLEEDPDGFSKRELLDLGIAMMDRSVTQPKTGPGGGSGPAVALQVTFVESPHKQSEALGNDKPTIVIEGKVAPDGV